MIVQKTQAISVCSDMNEWMDYVVVVPEEHAGEIEHLVESIERITDEWFESNTAITMVDYLEQELYTLGFQDCNVYYRDYSKEEEE